MTRFTLRIPKQLHRKIKELADSEKRSMNSQIVLMLEQKMLAHEYAKRAQEKLKGD